MQTEAVIAYASWSKGYTVTGADAQSRRLLNLHEPICGPLLEHDIVPSGARYRLPQGTLGVCCQFVFTFGRPYPMPGEAIDLASLLHAIIHGRPGLVVLARRVTGAVPLNDWTATADFGLAACHVIGAGVVDPGDPAARELSISAVVDGQKLAEVSAGDALRDALDGLVHLARVLAGRGNVTEAGDIVAVSACCGILQAIPGQQFEADFGRWGRATLRLR
ncbi:2-keto-4-pentenoate hydratase [Kaistia dalseonensis]|uniref:2-keto-4-pentenoate hydratase n=1 Tax=Kaistia dalseonensis TaxID=410840 RepID=A0ABU0H4L0_9HYPH|nr:hypothetical protein [Kaistia dalseonensis]MDQ0437243.1 2-keto-4-pentenoate hydratase [Kaistia dalseonensis]